MHNPKDIKNSEFMVFAFLRITLCLFFLLPYSRARLPPHTLQPFEFLASNHQFNRVLGSKELSVFAPRFLQDFLDIVTNSNECLDPKIFQFLPLAPFKASWILSPLQVGRKKGEKKEGKKTASPSFHSNLYRQSIKTQL